MSFAEKRPTQTVLFAEDAQGETESKADDQYRKMGAEFVGTALSILSLCLRGQTVRAQQSDLDPDTAKHTNLCELLQRLDKASSRVHRKT